MKRGKREKTHGIERDVFFIIEPTNWFHWLPNGKGSVLGFFSFFLKEKARLDMLLSIASIKIKEKAGQRILSA